ncbi:MAG: hypothetical protein ACI9W2_002669 [Gammaproteobacteria bacterium]|jgi:hypothetical protein
MQASRLDAQAQRVLSVRGQCNKLFGLDRYLLAATN